MAKSIKITGIKFIKKGALMYTIDAKKLVRNLSHIVVFQYPDYHTGSYYEMMYFHHN